MTDLVVLVADKDIEQSVLGLLGRHQAVGMRQISYDVITHPGRDPGCFAYGHSMLSLYRDAADHALMLFDAAWEGRPSADPVELEDEVHSRLHEQWGSAARCVVIDPEIEQWVWSASSNVARVLGWQSRDPALRTWLRLKNLWPEGAAKPPDPKAAFESCLREVRVPPSAAIFRQLASQVGIGRCSDPSFLRLLAVLREWFPPPNSSHARKTP
jgi:hypothetical protein